MVAKVRCVIDGYIVALNVVCLPGWQPAEAASKGFVTRFELTEL